MIVRNEEHCLAQCLESVRDLASEIILVDTGSTDRTVEIAQQFGAKVIQTSWNDHYAEARNLGLVEAMGDWVMILDADEVVSPGAKHLLPAYLRHYQGQDVVLNWRVCSSQHPDLYSRGLFPNHRGIEFAGRVHEVPVLPGKELSSYHCQDLVLWHESLGDQEAKLKYYQQLLKQNLVEETEAARMNHVQKHLGLNHLALAEWSSAWNVLSDCYLGMQELDIQPTDGFYGEVLRGLVQAGLQLRCLEVRKYAVELQRIYPAEPMQEQVRLVRPRRNLWRQGVLTLTLGALAACQSVSTRPTSSPQKQDQQIPILLNAENLMPTVTPSTLTGYTPRIGDFSIKEVYWCPPYPSAVTACYASGGHPVPSTTQSVDSTGFPCYNYDYCEGGIVPTPTPPPIPTPAPSATSTSFPPGLGGASGGCLSKGGGNYNLNLVYDFDPKGPDITIIVVPQFSDGNMTGAGITVTSTSTGPANLVHAKGPGGSKDSTVRDLFNSRLNTNLPYKIREENRNKAWDSMIGLDEASVSVDVSKLATHAYNTVKDSHGKQMSPHLAQIANDLSGRTVPISFQAGNRTWTNTVYSIAANLDRPGADFSKSMVNGGTGSLKIRIPAATAITSNGQRILIPAQTMVLNLTKQVVGHYVPDPRRPNVKKELIKWGFSCG